jgi:hypothetical protein
MGACVEGDQLMIVTELMPRGSVEDLIHKNKAQLPFKQRMKVTHPPFHNHLIIINNNNFNRKIFSLFLL